MHESDSREVVCGRLADTVVERASETATHRRVLDILRGIEADTYLEDEKRRLQHAIDANERYWDMCCVLGAYTELYQPAAYLEIGVRQGRSAAIVAASHPNVTVYLFDMWYPDYAGVPNPGPDFVRSQLERAGHQGATHFITGRSQQTVPTFFADLDNPQSVPLITVDGDHRDAGARADLDNVIGRLARGGMLVFDDIVHPSYPALKEMWEGFTAEHPNLEVRRNTVDATGTAVALNPA